MTSWPWWMWPVRPAPKRESGPPKECGPATGKRAECTVTGRPAASSPWWTHAQDLHDVEARAHAAERPAAPDRLPRGHRPEVGVGDHVAAAPRDEGEAQVGGVSTGEREADGQPRARGVDGPRGRERGQIGNGRPAGPPPRLALGPEAGLTPPLAGTLLLDAQTRADGCAARVLGVMRSALAPVWPIPEPPRPCPPRSCPTAPRRRTPAGPRRPRRRRPVQPALQARPSSRTTRSGRDGMLGRSAVALGRSIPARSLSAAQRPRRSERRAGRAAKEGREARGPRREGPQGGRLAPLQPVWRSTRMATSSRGAVAW